MGVGRVLRNKTTAVVGACLLMLVAAGGAGVLLWSTVRGDPDAQWDAYRVDGRTLVLFTRERSCDELELVRVREREQRVEVTVAVESGGLFCSFDAVDKRVRVRLDEPLGRRPVLDGACLAEDERPRDCVRDER